jgi:hypothetical protein
MNVITRFLEHYSYRFPKGYPDMNNLEDKAMLYEILEKLDISRDLLEVSLSPTQLSKPYYTKNDSNSEFNDRGENFLQKILDGDEFELTDGSKIVINPEASKEAIDILKTKKYIDLGGNKKIFIDTNGNSYNLSKFKKTEEFGSGSGSGGGAKNTTIQESTQSVVAAIAFKIVGGSITVDDLTDKNVDKALSYCDITSSSDEVKQFIKNPSWVKSLVLTANALYSKYQGVNFEFHRGSSFVQSIYDAFKAAAKESKLTFQSDKWNPADIWLVTPEVKNISFPTNINELNGLILNLLIDEKLIGVSLKKLSGEASLSYYNVSKDELSEYNFKDVISTNKSKDAKIVYNDGVVVFRTFNFATNFAGEIQGKSAAQGKIGFGALNDILRLNSLSELIPTKESKILFNENNDEIINDFYKVYSEIVENISKNEFISLTKNKDIDWNVSKYTALKLSSIIKNAPKSNQTEVISDIIRYSSSSMRTSSSFLKVS